MEPHKLLEELYLNIQKMFWTAANRFDTTDLVVFVDAEAEEIQAIPRETVLAKGPADFGQRVQTPPSGEGILFWVTVTGKSEGYFTWMAAEVPEGHET